MVFCLPLAALSSQRRHLRMGHYVAVVHGMSVTPNDLAALKRDEQIVETMMKLATLVDKLTDALVTARSEQAELRDEVHALSNRIESVARTLNSRTDHLA